VFFVEVGTVAAVGDDDSWIVAVISVSTEEALIIFTVITVSWETVDDMFAVVVVLSEVSPVE